METATMKREEVAGGRLIQATNENRKLAVELNELICQLRSHLVGSIPTNVEEKEKAEPSGLIFRVSNDIEETNHTLRSATETIQHLCNEFSVGQSKAQAS